MTLGSLLKRSVYLLVLALLLANRLPAQTDKNRFQIFAPNTFELAKYGDIPVDLSSGVPQISLPLTKLVDKDISLDVSLSYHASGIKVDQEATWVGLGWILNCGGVITREVRGNPDGFDYNGNFKPRSTIRDWDYHTNIDVYCSQEYNALQSAALNGTDNGADMFYFNFNGRSGKFFLDEQANAVFTKYEDFKVQFISVSAFNSDINKFVITDEQGIKYEFRDLEYNSPVGSGGMEYTSAWYLSEITSPSGGSMIIEYKQGGQSTNRYNKRCYNQAYFAANPNNSDHTLPQEYCIPCIFWDQYITGLVPRKITTSTGNSIELVTSSTPRTDAEELLLNNQLSTIIVRDVLQAEVRRFNFGYGFFEANNDRKFPTTQSNDPRKFLNYRLRLDAVQEVAPTGKANPAWQFVYYGDNDPATNDELTLPYRLSPSQDYWGYYNGTNNQTIFPYNPANRPWHKDESYMNIHHISEYGDGNQNFGFTVSNGGNREHNPEAVKAGMLKKIIYPTGGYTAFEFENHDFSSENFSLQIAGGVRVKQIESNSGNGPSVIKNYNYLDYQNSDKCTQNDNPYYTWFWNRQPDNPVIAEIMTLFGVPSSLATNIYVVRADGSSQLALGAGTNAVYTKVKESSPGNGYTTYEYDFASDGESDIGGADGSEGWMYPGIFYGAMVDTYGQPGGRFYQPFGTPSCSFPYPYFFNNDWRRGHLTVKEIYKEDGTLLQSDSTLYQIGAIKAIPGYKACVFQNGTIFFYARYYDVGGLVKPIAQITKMYAGNEMLRTVKEFSYTSSQHKQLTETRETSSRGESLTTNYYYPTEYPNLFTTLKDKHILSLVDIRSYNNGKLVSGQQISYTDAGLPTMLYKAETNMANPTFSPQMPFTFNPRAELLYNGDNTLRSQSDITGNREIFLWSYKGLYPVAKIENASYAEVLAALNDQNESFVNQLRNKATPDAGELATLNALRQNATLGRAQITTYTYKPLAGMTSLTDLNGRTTYYEYDGFSRLSLVRDQNGSILKKICYNYKGQPESCVVFSSEDRGGNYYPRNCTIVQSPEPYYVEVPAGMFTSTISPDDATAQAEEWARQQADTYGTCKAIDIPIYYNSNSWDPTYVELYNTSTGQSYFFEIPHGNGELGYVPSGVYDVHYSSDVYYYYWIYLAGCSSEEIGYGNASIYGVTLDNNCNQIQIW
jgi:YD repeat-containing protein